jgi:uncharacterized protein
MLIEFRVTNYRSIHQTQTLSMAAGPGTEHLETHTCVSGVKDPERLLRCAVIYGPNAAGKTNVLRAIDFMKGAVLGSAVASPTAATRHDPFRLSSESREAASEFEISFIQDDILYEYGFKVTAKRITEEWLIEHPFRRPREVFCRTYNSRSNSYDWKFSKAFRGDKTLWRNATRENALFLSTAAQFNSQHLLPVFSWFQDRLVSVPIIESFRIGDTIKMLGSPEGKEILLPFVREADPGIADLEMKREPMAGAEPMPRLGSAALRLPGGNHIIIDQATPNSPPEHVQITFSHNSTDGNGAVEFDMMQESSGTQALFLVAGAWLTALRNGEILLFDELDTSLHPLLARFLIQQFHSNITNPNGSQLICSTHDTTLLDTKILRRDQIWFVEKGEDRSTNLFPLSDFSPRKDDALERNYLRGRFGALPILDVVSP